MGESSENLRRKIDGASDLGSVVRTMKALAASSIGQYERSVLALNDYYRTVEMGLVAYLKNFNQKLLTDIKSRSDQNKIVHAVVFGSDQGLVGQFNEQVAEYALKMMSDISGEKKVWAVGQRVSYPLMDSKLSIEGTLTVPNSVNAITPLIAEILKQLNIDEKKSSNISLYLFHNKPTIGVTYEPVFQRLLPLDDIWRKNLSLKHWSGNQTPQVMGDNEKTLKNLIREYLFVSLFRACSESLASENASRMAAMQRAEKNIEELLNDLNQEFFFLRQNSIDEELFDVISGFEALN